MDLYGDLPPASSSSSRINSKDDVASTSGGGAVIQGGGWSSTTKSSFLPRQISKKPALPNVSINSMASNFSVPADEKSVSCIRTTQFDSIAVSDGSIPSAGFQAQSAPATGRTLSGTTRQKPQRSYMNSEKEEFNMNIRFDNFSSNGVDLIGEFHRSEESCEYDPRQPNDYIAYCAERLQQKRQLRVTEENRRLLEQQQRAREELEAQRQAALHAGDYARVAQLSSASALISDEQHLEPVEAVSVSSTGIGGLVSGMGAGISMSGSFMSDAVAVSGRGRGRGRGMSNLPAWMTQQMQEQQEAASGAGGLVGQQKRVIETDGDEQDAAVIVKRRVGRTAVGTGTTASIGEMLMQGGNRSAPVVAGFSQPSCVVLLKNMVGVSEVDEQLAEETQRECERYGAVTACRVHLLDARPGLAEDERVLCFVAFERMDSALKAHRELNGRFFAGRRVSAEFFEEHRFRAGQLTPMGTS